MCAAVACCFPQDPNIIRNGRMDMLSVKQYK